MLRTVTLLFLIFTFEKAFAGIGVELDVVFNDSTVQCWHLYVLRHDTKKANDTLAVFDTLSFIGQSRVSLFYSVGSARKNILSMVDSDGVHVESKPFSVSPWQTVFTVGIGQHQIFVTGKDFLYPRKKENEHSYIVFLLIFFAVKSLIVAIFNTVLKLLKRNIFIATGAFLLSAFIDWLLPINYLYRFLIIMLTEYLLIALVGCKSISWLRAAMLVLIINIVGYGIITILYLLYVFW